MEKKTGIIIYKIIVAVLTVACILAVWIVWLKGINAIFLRAWLSVLLIFICYCLMQRNLYVYKTGSGKEIVVFAGLYDHYISVEGERVDEHKSGFYFTPIKMSYEISETEKIETEITLTNRVKTKINGKIVFPITKV